MVYFNCPSFAPSVYFYTHRHNHQSYYIGWTHSRQLRHRYQPAASAALHNWRLAASPRVPVASCTKLWTKTRVLSDCLDIDIGSEMSTIYTVDWTQFLGPDSELPPDITFTVIQSSGTYKGRSRNCQAYEICMLSVWSSCPQIDPRWSQPCVQKDVLLLCNLGDTIHHGERGHRNYGFRVLCFPKYDHIYLFKGNAVMNGLHAMIWSL